MEKYYKVANLIVRMSSFGRTVEQGKPYLCEPAEPDIVIRTDWRALQKAQPHLSDEACEYLCTGSSFYTQLLKFDGILLHASAVVMDGRAYLFSAPCGTGKSTHTGLWLKIFGQRAFILNDDKPALRLEDGQWFAYGTPWSGKYDLSVNVRAPVAGICFLHQAAENTIAPFAGPQAIYAIFQQTVRPSGAVPRQQLMTLLDKLLTQVSVWQMGCNMDIKAAVVSYEAMSGEACIN